MKRKKLLGLGFACLLLISGCSASTLKENGKDVIATIDGKSFLADDIYNNLSASTSGKSLLFTYLLDELIDANFPVTSDMRDNADNIMSNIEANYKNQYSDSQQAQTQLETALLSQGYKDVDAYKESLVQALQYSEFLKHYVNTHFDEVFEDYYKMANPRYVSLVKVSVADPAAPTAEETEKLNEVKSLLKSGKSFEAIAVEYSDDSTKTAKGNLGIVDKTSQSKLESSYGEDVAKAALSLSVGKTSEAIKGTDGYYFLYCPSQDKASLKKDLTAVDVDSPLLVYDDYMVYLAFNTYSLDYSSDDVKNKIKAIVDESLALRTKEREG